MFVDHNTLHLITEKIMAAINAEYDREIIELLHILKKSQSFSLHFVYTG